MNKDINYPCEDNREEPCRVYPFKGINYTADEINRLLAAIDRKADISMIRDGRSAYEVAVANGYTGTEEQWLASLRGPRGEAFEYEDLTPAQIEILQSPATEAGKEVKKETSDALDSLNKEKDAALQELDTRMDEAEVKTDNAIKATEDAAAQALSNSQKQWYPNVDGEGNLSWSRSSSTTPPAGTNIRGPQGNSGVSGSTDNIVVVNDLNGGESTPEQIKVLAAEQGKVLKGKFDEIGKRINELNISALYPTSGIDGSNRYTLETAIAQVSSEYRVRGVKVTFVNESGDTESWEYKGNTWSVDYFKEVGAKIISKLEISTLGNKVLLGSQTYEVGSSLVKHTYNLPNLIADKKLRLFVQSDDIEALNYIGLKLNNKLILSTPKIINIRSGVYVEVVPTLTDLSNSNQLNYIEITLSAVTKEGALKLFQIISTEEEFEKNNIGIDTLVQADTIDLILKEEDFSNSVSASFVNGLIKENNNKKGTSFKKLGTTKDVLMAASSTIYGILAYDKDKNYKYFIQNTNYSIPTYYKFTEDIEYIVINGGNLVSNCPIGSIIYNVPIIYACDDIRNLQQIAACPSKVFTYDEFFNTKETQVATYASSPSTSASHYSRIKLDVRDYIGMQSSNRALNTVYEYDANGNCVASYCYQTASDNWYVRGAIKFHPETAYITVTCVNSYKTNIILYKKPSSRSYISAIDNEKFSRNSRMLESRHFGDSTSDEGWADSTNKEVDYWTLAARMLGITPLNMAKAASSFLPFKGSGSVAGELNTPIYDKTKLLSDFEGLITILGGTNDYNGGWDGAVWTPTSSADKASKLMLTQENGKELFRELSVKKFEDLLTIDDLLADHDNHFFEEAFLYTIWDLKIRNPKALIICISPFGRIGEEYPNIVGATLQDYRNAEKRICQLLGIPFLDVQDVVGGINHDFYFNASESETSAAEGLHPNAVGHKAAGAWLTIKVREYIDMWELLNNGYIDTAYDQGQSKGAEQARKMFAKETFELKDYIVESLKFR